ncbi:MAG: hypothetical protein H7A49_00245 [Akkermansiaceae bacterium]|nr:hypothetical protein [Akkermansiaceae bacterium]MCP5542312.1 hypothetical protein [Akkermansiaceae bacterium]MCP5546151.1 hypothetical protein [Akkermansiaceae bacterium]
MKHILICTALSPVLLFTSCTAPAGPNTQRGAATGALLGAGAGAIIGHQSGRTLEGAALGAGAGGATGAIIGNEQDKRQYGY